MSDFKPWPPPEPVLGLTRSVIDFAKARAGFTGLKGFKMPVFNIFRASFDGSLRPRERRNARIAALVVTTAAVVTGAVGFLATLHMNSEALTEMANSGPGQDVRVLGAESVASKPCEEQTWPFIEGRCLIKADTAKSANRTTPKHGLASRDVALPAPNAAPPANVPPRSTAAAVAPAPPAPKVAATETTGSAPREETVADRAQEDASAIPLPPARPTQVAALTEPAPATEERPARIELGPQRLFHDGPVLSRRESLRLREEERRELRTRSREMREEAAREEARRARELRTRARDEERETASTTRGEERETRPGRSERRDSRAERRGNRDDSRIVRRWTEYTYMTPYGGSRRIIVIRRGSADDEFFRTIR